MNSNLIILKGIEERCAGKQYPDGCEEFTEEHEQAVLEVFSTPEIAVKNGKFFNNIVAYLFNEEWMSTKFFKQRLRETKKDLNNNDFDTDSLLLSNYSSCSIADRKEHFKKHAARIAKIYIFLRKKGSNHNLAIDMYSPEIHNKIKSGLL